MYATDENGETILHLAVRCNQLEVTSLPCLSFYCMHAYPHCTPCFLIQLMMVLIILSKSQTTKYLVENKKIEKRTHNSMGKTPLDILDESPPGTTRS